MAVGGWKLLVEICLPIPIILIFLIALPLPRVVRKGVLIFTKNTLDLNLVSVLRLAHVMMGVTGYALATTSYECLKIANRPAEVDPSPNRKTMFLSEKWRAERNWWISIFCFTMWIVLFFFYRLAADHMRIKERLARVEAELPGGGPPPGGEGPPLQKPEDPKTK